MFTRVTETPLRQAFERLGLGVVDRFEGIAAGTVNTSYLCTTVDGTRYFLRLYEEQDVDGARREARLLEHLCRCGVKVPAPMCSPWIVSGIFELEEKPAAVFPWIDGDMLCQRAVDDSAMRQVGQALARVHEAGVPAGLEFGGGRFEPERLLERLPRIDASDDPEARAERRSLESALLRVLSSRKNPGPRGLVHGDLFRDNVLWTPERTLCALLDFESAQVGPYAYDLAVTLLSWCFDDRLRLDLGRALCEGYASVRVISPEQAEAIYDEAWFATVRFAITRITDNAIRVGKRWQRFVERRKALEALGKVALLRELGLLERTQG